MTVDYRIFDRDKFTVVGSPTITDDGIASGFSGSNYLRTSSINFNSKKWKVSLRFLFNTLSATNTLCGTANNAKIALSLFTNNKLNFENQISNWFAVTSDTLQLNTLYDAEFGQYIDGTNCVCYLSYKTANSQDFITKTVIKDTSFYLTTQEILSIGKYSNYNPASQCSIDLSQFSIEVDGVEVFSGSHLGTLTDKLVYLNDTKQIIKSAIEAKGVEVPTETPFRQYADKIGEISSSPVRRTIPNYTVVEGYTSLYSRLGSSKILETDGIWSGISTLAQPHIRSNRFIDLYNNSWSYTTKIKTITSTGNTSTGRWFNCRNYSSLTDFGVNERAVTQGGINSNGYTYVNFINFSGSSATAILTIQSSDKVTRDLGEWIYYRVTFDVNTRESTLQISYDGKNYNIVARDIVPTTWQQQNNILLCITGFGFRQGFSSTISDRADFIDLSETIFDGGEGNIWTAMV